LPAIAGATEFRDAYPPGVSQTDRRSRSLSE
jgi:hypothetical protein